MRHIILSVLMMMLAGASPAPKISFTSYAAEFDAFAARTDGMVESERIAAFKATFERIMPGLYTARDPARLDRRIAKALAEFPSIRPGYRQIEQRFPAALDKAASHFRAYFPTFASPLPIYLVHELGVRDGGSDYVGARKVMLFGADMMAKLHNDSSLQPFLDHELFHLEHARHFADCDQFWCPLWQEGLATYAAGRMNPGATDHDLMLDQPAPIRAPTDTRWVEALCLVAAKFDGTDQDDIAAAFTAGDHAPNMPARYGYYVGMRVAAEAAQTRSLAALAELNDDAARPVVRRALGRLLARAHAGCAPPPSKAAITHVAARPA